MINNLEMVRMVCIVEQDPETVDVYEIEDSRCPGFRKNVSSTRWFDMMSLPSDHVMTASIPP